MKTASAAFSFVLVALLSNFEPIRPSHTFGIKNNHLDLTLVGANGDLAKKYLWNGLLQLYKKYSYEHDTTWSFTIYGAGTKNASNGQDLLNKTITNAINCAYFDEICKELKKLFIYRVKYVQLQNKDHYAQHCSSLASKAMQNHCHKGFSCTYQSIFYLSVPPFTYESISEHISSHCRPPEGTGSLKVIFEKPFGHHQKSAHELALSMGKHLHDKEIYRVDHYLGKQSVEEIIGFRRRNEDIEKVLNGKTVERIEIVMKETVDVKGRTAYYDHYGVVLDVMQNHLSEVLYLLTMELPLIESNKLEGEIFNKNKQKIVQEIVDVNGNDVVFDYQDEFREDSSNPNITSRTPTFAGVMLKISSNRWRNVPVLMVAGKKLDERTGYARVIFKEDLFSVKNDRECPLRKELIFHIGHGSLGTAAILVSRSLPLNKSYVPDGWSLTNDCDDYIYLQSKGACYHVFVPNTAKDAYTYLIEQAFLGNQEHFLTRQALLDSFRIWNHIIDSTNKFSLQLYDSQPQAFNTLNFFYSEKGLEFSNDGVKKPEHSLNKQAWLGHSMFAGDNVYSSLADDIYKVALAKARLREDFNIAFSGGSSPLKLYDQLVDRLPAEAWENFHIWQVDERCTTNEDHSNFFSLFNSLISKVPSLKHKNIHPMPVKTSTSQLCSNESALVYEQDMKLHLGDEMRFDYIVLGMGSDGHTASLFPYHQLLQETERFVAIAENVPVESTPKRMTITYPTIKSASNVAVLIVGQRKCEILGILEESKCNGDTDLLEYPVCGVLYETDNVSLYVDASCDNLF